MNIKGNKDREGFDGCYAQSRAGSTVLDSFRLNGKVALVTGGAGNYGRQIAEALGEAGAITYIASRNLETLESFAGELRERGLDVTALQYDQGQEESILELRENILERSVYIDILVNNALGKFDKRDFKNDTERFAASMQVNATGIFTITKSFADVMAKRGKGSIINIASIYGMVGLDTTLYIGTDMIDDSIGDYYFHKGGMISYTRYVAGYYGAKV